MSSKYVRDQIKTYLETEFPTETFVDFSDNIDLIAEVLEEEGIGRTDPWVGIRFVGSFEEPVDIQSANGKGCYREVGAIYIDVADMAKLGAGDLILIRAEAIRNKLRSRRINNIIIRSVTPPNFGAGASLIFEGGFISASFIIEYQNDINV